MDLRGMCRADLSQMENAMNNCFIKGAMSGVMGFGMGGLFGLFMASVRFPFPFPPLPPQPPFPQAN